MKYLASKAASQIGLAPSTLNYYADKGVCNPERDSSGRRLYSLTDIQAVKSYRERKEQQRR